jgi:formate-dependent nitrite reductase cytochrome c552 subunit
MLFDIGYVVISRNVLEKMRSSSFAYQLANALHKHMYHNDFENTSMIPEMLDQGAQIRTRYAELIAITEKDKNKMPRTSIVLWDEGGV